MQVFLTEWLVTLPCKPAFFAVVGRKFANFVFTKQTSHIPHVTALEKLVFLCLGQLMGGLWSISFAMINNKLTALGT